LNYLLNTWYVIAWSDEVNNDLFHRKIIEKSILLYRNKKKSVIAMDNRCPHRFAPLHMGELDNDIVKCKYHGLQYNSEGKCVLNPHGDGAIPKAAVVRTYPTVEKHKMIWIWMGDVEKANPELIPDFSMMDDPAIKMVKGVIYGSGNYELYTDNIMDLGHAEFLHPTLGAPVFTTGPRDIYQDKETIWSNMWAENECLAPLHSQLHDLIDQPMNWWIDTRWNAPACMDLTLHIAEAGESREKTKFRSPSLHLFTPESATTTYYFWAIGRTVKIDDRELDKQLQDGFAYIFETEDKPVIAAQQESMGTPDLWELKPVLLAGDAGGVRARRLLAKMISEEMAT